MKKKFLIGVLLVIILFSFSSVFAVSNNITNSNNISSENKSSNNEDEISEENLIPALEEKLKEQQNEENKASESTNTVENGVTSNSTKNEITNNSVKNEVTTESKTNKKREEIFSDIYIAEDNDLLYENAYIDGNVYIISNKVEFKNCEILGNVFIISKDLIFEGTEIDGSIYVVADNVNLIETKVKSIYTASNTINTDEKSKVENDIRVVANIANILGDVGRDSFVQVFENSNIEYSVTIQELLPEILTKFIIILIITIIILGSSPKFVGVNLSLKISSFFKAFFTGILEIIVILLIALGIMFLGYGVGFAFAILLLLGAILCFGKVIFVTAFGLRLVKNSNKNVRVKAFIFTIFVAIIVEALDLLPVLGEIGFLSSLTINVILAITGFGTLIRVAFTAKKKKVSENNVSVIKETAPVQIEKTVEPVTKVEEKPVEPVKEEVKPEFKNDEKEDSKTETFEIKGQFVKKDISSNETKEQPEEKNKDSNEE